MMTDVAASGRGFWARHGAPTTRLGRIACWLGLGFIAWFVANQTLMGLRQSLEGIPVIPIILFGFLGLACGLAASVVGALAVVRKRERSVLVFLTLLPGLLVLFFLIGELLVPH